MPYPEEDVSLITSETRTTYTAPQRNLLSGGLAIAVRGLPALLWTYLLSLGVALLFSARFFGQWNALLSHSLAAQSLTSAFDIGTLGNGALRLSERVPGGNPPSFGGLIVFSIVSFLLVPGALFCYAAPAPARLSTLLRAGIEHFWRFVRITLVTLVVGGILLGLLAALNNAISGKIDDHLVGRPAFILDAVGLIFLFLVASVLRLYVDLVGVYTVQLGLQTTRPNTRSDRRVRLTLKPAWRTLTRYFASAWLTFLLLTVLGLSVLALATRFLIGSLAQPRVWPAFLVMQLAILFDLFTRFWQRGAETVLAQNHPLPFAPVASTQSAFTTAVPAPPAPPTHLHTPPGPITPRHPATHPEPLAADPPLPPDIPPRTE